jgi:hypothetical protein
LRATARYSSGEIRDVTNEATWASSNASVVSVSKGLATAVAAGDARITAFYQTATAAGTMTVRPDGQYRVRGRVVEPGNVPIAQALIEVVDGPSAGRSIVTSAFGSFEMWLPSCTLRISRDGYLTAMKSITVTADTTLDLEIQPASPPSQIGGAYALVIQASASCSALPDAAQRRTYTASIDQTGAAVKVLLNGPNFVVKDAYGSRYGDRFAGRVQGNRVNLTVSIDEYYGLFDVVERLDERTYISFSGTIDATPAGRQISGPMQGIIAVYDATDGFYGRTRRVTASCTKSDHLVTFTR